MVTTVITVIVVIKVFRVITVVTVITNNFLSLLIKTTYFYRLAKSWIGLIQVKEEGWTVFSKGWQGCPRDFPRAKSEEYPEE